jgi:hypothetical protein
MDLSMNPHSEAAYRTKGESRGTLIEVQIVL